MDFGTIVQIVIGAGVGTAIVQGLIVVYRERRQSRVKAAHLALRIAVLLERYAAMCADFISDNANAPHDPDSEFPNWKIALPELLPFPDDASAWQALNQKLAGQSLGLRNRVLESQTVIQSVAEFTEEELGETLDEHAAQRGLEAWRTAAALRLEYELASAETVWDYSTSLEQTLSQIETKREQKAEFRKRAAVSTPKAP